MVCGNEFLGVVYLPTHTMAPSSSIRNKHKRAEVYDKEKRKKVADKLARRKEIKRNEVKDPSKREARLTKNVPATLDNKRVYDETIVDGTTIEDLQDDEFAKYFQDGLKPKVLVTTSRGPSRGCYEFAEELVGVFPGAEYVKRGHKFSVKEIAQFCSQREYTDVLIVHEDQRKVNSIQILHLPHGPSLLFSITSIEMPKRISGHGRATSHDPELILNNFSTRLGHTVGRMFQALFPQAPDFYGRQVVTLHNQRDFIFFRRHRYVFKDTEKVGLQELGPRFTLKLRRIVKGIKGEVEWEHRADMEVNRRKFYI